MKMRQAAWENPFFVVLSADSSPQGGTDYLMTLEDRISKEAAGMLMLAGEDPERLDAWIATNPVQTASLPAAVVGSGNSNLAAKHEALFHSVMGSVDCVSDKCRSWEMCVVGAE